MSTQITQFSVEIVLAIIESIENRDDLLALALACQSFYRIIIPHYLSYIRVSRGVKDLEFWKDLSRNPTSCRKIRELKLMEDSGYPDSSDIIGKALLQMVNISRIVFVWVEDYGFSGKILDGLINSKCCLKEIDLVNRFSDSEAARQIKELPISTKFNVTVLKKLSFRLIWNIFNRTLPQLDEVVYINGMLSNARALTHLLLNIEETSSSVFIDLLGRTWPNLENLTIGRSFTLSPLGTLQDPSILIEFFRRHPKLTVLSLPSHVYLPDFSPYITVEDLPRLEAFSYVTNHRIHLNQILSSASTRRLEHLTILLNNDSFEPENLKIYEELTSLKTCSIQGSLEYDNINQILDVLVRSATDLRKLYLPKHLNGNIRETPFVTLSILRFLNLKYLFGIWAIDLSCDGPDQQKLLAELYYIPQLKYLFPALYQVDSICPMTPFRLTRDHNCQLTIEVEKDRVI
ncbi:hypothetical protein Clacol_001229 [Clathrus columnatus]|uniref:F-box domain-containing protein n=1 Tax=Clathrus columnatus TaxID=1419009 RepID=A0AAV5A1Z4_9AGAM|nr:hypothetical protein Clacol_001229 [Clathrus columnatus]